MLRTRTPTGRGGLLAAIMLLVIAVVPDPAAASVSPERVVVTFADGTTAAERAVALAGVTTVTVQGATAGAHTSGGAATPAVVRATPAQRARLAADTRVAAVEVDIPTRAAGVNVDSAGVTVHDPQWSRQHGVRRIGADRLWQHTTGDRELLIAVVDTGVDPTNPDLAGRVLSGHDFVNGDRNPRDDNGHGTAVATIAAAAADGYGIAGVCWRCRVLPVKVLDASGNGFLSDAALGIRWAVERGADVINVSLGAPGTMRLLDDALAAARRAGVLVVASAGNDGTSARQWPAADPRVMGIAALGAQDRRAGYSSYGSWVDAAAPGCNPAGWLDHGIVEFCGTSSAAPLVSGTAALLSVARGSSAGDIRAALRATAAPAGPGVGSGRIDGPAALRALPTFRDTHGSVHAANIEVLAAAGIASGCGDGRYCPLRKVTRGQIATLLHRALGLPAGTATFADVPADHPHAAGVAAVAAAGIAGGCGADRFCPADHLTRAQMATMLQRALELGDGPPRFTDVPSTHAHARGIWALAANGITTGCTATRYCPRVTVDRGQMASFLARGLDL